MVPGGLTLRVSLLAQCQYDCAYCRPGSVAAPSPSASWLSPAEYGRLAALFSELGVRKVRFTGGEPLLRPDLPAIVRAFAAALPAADLAVTTNGQHLPRLVRELASAGLKRATVHVDSLRQHRYEALMGPGEVSAVLAGVLEAKKWLKGVKLNVVVQRGKNDDELTEFLAWSRCTGVEVRFIELMNTGSASAYIQKVFISAGELLTRLSESLRFQAIGRRNDADPASLFRTEEGVVFGLIASDSAPFCEACDRLRLTANGRLRGCLYESGGVPIGEALKRGAADDELRALLRRGLGEKRSHHPLRAPGLERTAFSMAETGG